MKDRHGGYRGTRDGADMGPPIDVPSGAARVGHRQALPSWSAPARVELHKVSDIGVLVLFDDAPHAFVRVLEDGTATASLLTATACESAFPDYWAAVRTAMDLS